MAKRLSINFLIVLRPIPFIIETAEQLANISLFYDTYNYYKVADGVELIKLGCRVKPEEVTLNGSRNLHAVERVNFDGFEIINIHSPLVSFGRGKILEFDNKHESLEKDGISFVLQNNVWGTNFPLWYEDNARFVFKIKAK